jgi:transposase
VLVFVATRQESDTVRLRAEANRLGCELAASQARVVELEGLVAALREKVATLAKLVFGTSSEKNQASQKQAVPSSGEDAGAAAGEPRRRRGQQPGSTGHGRRDYSGLETVEEIHDLPKDERVCPQCDSPYAPFGEETSEQVDWRVRIVRIVHRRPTYRRTCHCPVAGVLVAQVPAKPILKGRFTTQFLARLLVEKYVLGRPLERVVAALDADGLEVAKGTLVGVLKALSVLLAPLDEAIRARNATAGHLHVDETSWRVFEDLVWQGEPPVVAVGLPRPRHHRVPHRPDSLRRCITTPSRHRGAGLLARGRQAPLGELGLLHGLPVARPGRGSRPAVVLGAHPPLLHPRRRCPQGAESLEQSVARADRSALRGAPGTVGHEGMKRRARPSGLRLRTGARCDQRRRPEAGRRRDASSSGKKGPCHPRS